MRTTLLPGTWGSSVNDRSEVISSRGCKLESIQHAANFLCKLYGSTVFFFEESVDDAKFRGGQYFSSFNIPRDASLDTPLPLLSKLVVCFESPYQSVLNFVRIMPDALSFKIYSENQWQVWRRSIHSSIATE